MTIYKRLQDFEDAMVNKQGQYEISGLPAKIQKGDIIYCDVCSFRDAHTYIKGRVIKRNKYVCILNYEYIDL